MPPLALPAPQRKLVHLLPVDLAPRGDEQQEVVRRGDEEVLDVVAFFEVHAHDPDAAAVLRAVGRDRQALDVAGGGDGDDHLLDGDHVLDVDLVLGGDDLGAAVVAVHLLDLEQFLFDHVVDRDLVGQQAFEIGDALQQVAMLLFDLVTLEGGEVAQAQVDDGLGLLLAEAEARHEAHLGRVGVFARADDADDLVDVGDGDQQPFEDVGPLLGLRRARTWCAGR